MSNSRRFIEKPNFMKKNKITGKERGNIYHALFEMLPIPDLDTYKELLVSEEYREKYVDDYLSDIKNKEIFNVMQLSIVDKSMISAIFTENNYDVFSKFVEAAELGDLYKEESFYTILDIDGSSVLIQGIVDAYFKFNDELYVIDYKTDRTNENKENVTELDLINRYKEQLTLYGDSLKKDKILNVENVHLYIYSVTLKKFIKI